MSFFSKILGGDSKKKSKASSPEETQSAIQKLRDMEEMLNKKQDHLELKIEKEHEKAKRNASKNKRLALQALKSKKRLESQLRQIDGTLTTIEYQREALENANTNAEVLHTMGIAAAAMKNAHKNMDIDDVNDLMDDIQEQNEVASQITEAISNPIGFGQDIDDDELAKELEDLEQEELDEQMVNISGPVHTDLPEVPTAEPRRAANPVEEDKDLKELAAWAS